MIRFSVCVHPGSSRKRLIKNPDNSFVAYVTERAQKDSANKAVIKLLSEHLDLAKTRIKIIRGERSRVKIIEIH